MKFIEEVEDVFDISGRGCVVVPGIPYDFEPSLSVGTRLQFNNPSGSIVTATLQGLEMINRGKPMNHAPFSVDRSIKKGDIEIGATMYLVECNE
ncbi:hypothetical protein [Shewanella algae]|uniref:hypothetical protein n=1 Tax=Shewanella algae TaxID=38313 RepID=UPI0031F59529